MSDFEALGVTVLDITRDGVACCTICGQPLQIGDFPCITTPRSHARALPTKGFEPHFDDGIGRYVTGWGDVRQAMREFKLDYRDHPSDGDKSARRDRIEEGRRHG